MNPTKNAKFALVILDPPKNEKGGRDDYKWGELLKSIQQSVKPTATTQAIHENVWLIPLTDGTLFLAHLLGWVDSTKAHSYILFLDDKPDWIICPPIPAINSSQQTS